MHITTLRKVGNSIMHVVPPVLLDILQLRPGAKVGIAIESGRLIVKAHCRPRYRLDEMLSQCVARAPRNQDGARMARRQSSGPRVALIRRGEIAPVLIGSPEPCNRITKVPVVYPLQAVGVVRCDQPRALDLAARHGKKLESVPETIVDEVLAKLATIFE